MSKLEAFDREDAITALQDFIREGSYRPGDRLPPERELIVSLGISRNTLRRGLEALERDGAIWRHVGKGTFISNAMFQIIMYKNNVFEFHITMFLQETICCSS